MMPDDVPNADTLADDLLSIGAVTFSPDAPFTWASGLQSPVYCDNRLTLAHPRVRSGIAAGFVACLERAGIRPDGILGTATAGIPHAAWLADRLGLPMGYVRSKPKAHGRGHQVEGMDPSGRSVVVVEDLISTGMSSGAVVDVLRDAGAQVQAVLAIFSYGLPAAREAFARRSVPLFTLTTFDHLLAEACRRGMISPVQETSLHEWYRDPVRWSAARRPRT